MKILLVDDEPALRELLRVTFEGAHVVVEEAGSADEAVAVIARGLPDVVVLDVRMPGMDGIELCRWLRRSEATRDLRIVLLTGADDADIARARECGADEIVRKPFSPLDLLALVERLADHRARTPSRPHAAALHDEELLLYARDLRHLIEVERAQRQLLVEAYRSTVAALASALETKDTGTAEHSHRVRRYAATLLEAVDSGALARDPAVEYGFLLHDVGKIGIPDVILRKRGRLTHAERRRMQSHTVLGEQLLAGIPFLRGPALSVVRSHHERWDGGGYPDGLTAQAIPLAARVFAVADTLDAMTSDRPYRAALQWDDAHAEIVGQTGRQFDPLVVAAFRDCQQDLREAAAESAAA